MKEQIEKEKRTHALVLKYIERLNDEVGLSEKTLYEIRITIEDKIDYCKARLKNLKNECKNS